MGHIRLGTLSSSKTWRAVVGALEAGADVEAMAAAAAEASKRDLSRAIDDPTFQRVSRLLIDLPRKARALPAMPIPCNTSGYLRKTREASPACWPG